jgi:GNAT superfamily N-acetyltransferase
VPRLSEILVDVVDSGAGVTFMHPLAQDVAEAFWMKQKADVGSGQTTLFVAEENGVIAGTVMLQKVWPPNHPHRCEVAKLLVHRDFRRQGLATLLMQALEAKARALGFTLITFDTVAKVQPKLFTGSWASPAPATFRITLMQGASWMVLPCFTSSCNHSAISLRRVRISSFIAKTASDAVVSQTAGTKPWAKAANPARNSRPENLSANFMCSK